MRYQGRSERPDPLKLVACVLAWKPEDATMQGTDPTTRGRVFHLLTRMVEPMPLAQHYRRRKADHAFRFFQLGRKAERRAMGRSTWTACRPG
jgi:hypothetical protein